MRYLTKTIRALSNSSISSKPIIPSRFPRPILEMSPKFQFLTTSSPNAIGQDPASLLAEVLRCHSYLDETVFHNTIQVLTTTTAGTRADGVRLAKMRYIAMVYNSISESKMRNVLRSLADSIEKCRVPMLRYEQDLFHRSLLNADGVPNLEKCMHKNDLVLCYFRRELEMKNWKNVKKLLTTYPRSISLYEHIDAFLELGMHQKVVSHELFEVFMEYAKINNPYFVERVDFETVFQKIIKSCSARVSEDIYDKKSIKMNHISIHNAKLLRERIDEHVKGSKEGFVKRKEYEQVEKKVAEWKKDKKIRNGQGVVVVDALNFGMGRDPKAWKNISDKFENVFFATRLPPKNIREQVVKKYKGNALFCDKLSADDLVILRMALEFGPLTSLVTNDRYRDHRQVICNGDPILEKIWDDFLIDSVYRHFDGKIEDRRDFNIRILNQDGIWFIPVLESEGYSSEFRKLKVYCIENHQ